MQIKRSSEQNDKYNKVQKMSATIPATGKKSCVIIQFGYFDRCPELNYRIEHLTRVCQNDEL